MSMWSSSIGDYGMTSMEADPAPRNWSACSDPPAESCSDAGCPVHGDSEPTWEPDGLGLDDDEDWRERRAIPISSPVDPF